MEVITVAGSKCGIGIEVKYTEQSYKMKKGSSEEGKVLDHQSPYWRVTRSSGSYIDPDNEVFGADPFLHRNALPDNYTYHDRAKIFHRMVLASFGDEAFFVGAATSSNIGQYINSLENELNNLIAKDIAIIDLRSNREKEIIEDANTGSSLGEEVNPLINELLKICITEGFTADTESPQFNSDYKHIRTREIGEKLNDLGGMDLMKSAFFRV